MHVVCLSQLEERMKTEVSQLQEEKDELTKKIEENVESYKEQVRQHSVTICSMEERLGKLTKRNKDYVDELSTLKKANAGRFCKTAFGELHLVTEHTESVNELINKRVNE